MDPDARPDGSAVDAASNPGTDSAVTPTDGGAFVPPTCVGGSTERPPGAPVLVPGEWHDISPPAPLFGGGGSFTQGMAIDPCNPSTLYVCVVGFEDAALPHKGLYRSTDAGTTWSRIGPLDTPINVRVDPGDPQHLYASDGVTGSTQGFWVSHDGGDSWQIPDSFRELVGNGLTYDTYHVEPDPSDFEHVLVTFHSGWNGPGYDGNSGILESHDGGETWTIHPPVNPSWAGGYNVFFLYDPVRGFGNANTWLFGTQGDGYWRTTDAGAHWSKVSDIDMDHGGGSIYYTDEGVLYVSGAPNILRSLNNGETWTELTPAMFTAFLTVVGDGTSLYAVGHGGGRVMTALESNDTAWSELGGDPEVFFQGGSFELAFDPVHRILYSAHTGAGVWARQVPTR